MAIHETRVLHCDWLAYFLMFSFFQHAQGSGVGSWGMDLSHWLVVPTVCVVLCARLASPCMRDLVAAIQMHASFHVAPQQFRPPIQTHASLPPSRRTAAIKRVRL